jgi:hypothetical protein
MLEKFLPALALSALVLSSCQKETIENSASESERPFRNDFEAPIVNIISPRCYEAVWDTEIDIQMTDNKALKTLNLYEDGVIIQTLNFNANPGQAVTSFRRSFPYNPGIFDERKIKAEAIDMNNNKSIHEIILYKFVCC